MPIPSVRKIFKNKNGHSEEKWIGWLSRKPLRISSASPIPPPDEYGNVYWIKRSVRIPELKLVMHSAYSCAPVELAVMNLLRDSEKLLSRLEWHAKRLGTDRATE